MKDDSVIGKVLGAINYIAGQKQHLPPGTRYRVPVWPTDPIGKRRSGKGKVRERDAHRILRKRRRQMAKRSRQVNRARTR